MEIALYGKGITYLNDNQLTDAETIFKSIIAKRPEFAGPWANLALINIKNNDLAKAQENLNQALARDPSMPQIYNMLGYIEKKKGNINKAIDYYLQAIAKKPDYAIAHYLIFIFRIFPMRSHITSAIWNLATIRIKLPLTGSVNWRTL